MVLQAKLFPILLLRIGEYDHQFHRRVEPVEVVERVGQYGFTGQRQELFGQFATHASPFAAGDYDGISFHRFLYFEQR